MIDSLERGDVSVRWKGLDFLSRVPGMREDLEASPPPHRGEPSPWRVLRGAPIVHRSLSAIAAGMKRRGLNRLADATRRVWVAVYERLVPRVPPQERCELSDPGGRPSP
jgi:hypothetical protein